MLALAPGLVGTALMPMEHVHEGADHHHAVAHRHVEAHELGTHHHDEIEGARDEGRVVWLSDASLHQRAFHLSIDWLVATLTPDALRDCPDWIAAPSYDAAPPHGPPRPSCSPRAPPSLHA